jgi:hypothetical protein
MSAYRVGLVVALFLSAATVPVANAQQDAEIAKMTAEITQLTTEQDQNSGKLQQSLALKKQHEAQFARLDQDSNNIKAASSSLEAQRPNVDRLCHGTYPKAQLAAAQARCNAVLVPFNQQVNTLNGRRDRLRGEYQKVNQAEATRAAAAKQVLARNDQIRQRIAVLQASIRARQVAVKPQSCTQSCQSKSGEALSQCMQSCFDGARKDTGMPTVEEKYRPPSVITSNRTPQQAIEEYKASGKADATPDSFRRQAAPPPPPPR